MLWHKLFSKRPRKSNTKTENKTLPSAPKTSQTVSELKADELGRIRATNVPYILPKDLQEIHRLDFQHYLSRSIIKANYLAPITNPQHILDVGCGTGRWQYEIAQEFPQAQLAGLDIMNPTQITVNGPESPVHLWRG